MHGTFIGRKYNTKQQLKRLGSAKFTLRKRLKHSRLSKRQQAKVTEICAESTALFDSNARPWYLSEINQIQRSVDKIYRWIWSSKNQPPLMEMESKGKNMFMVRQRRKQD